MTPSQISQWLLTHETPFTDEDKSALTLLSKTYPYFVPSKYIESAAYHADHPFSPAILNKMRLYMGDWISFHDFLQQHSTDGIQNKMAVTDDFEDFEDDKPEYFFDTYEEEQEVLKIEDNQSLEAVFDDDAEEDFDYELFNEKVNEDEPFTAFDNRRDLPKAPEIKEKPAETAETATLSELITEEPNIVETNENVLETEPVEPVEEVTDIPVELLTGSKFVNTIIEEPEESAHVTKTEVPAKHKNEPLIQPIYTEDYFLHQGIEAETPQEEEEDKQLMVMMSFADWLLHFKTKTEKQKEDEEDQRALKTMWQKEKLAAALEEENDEIPENVFEMAVNSIKTEDDLASESLAEILAKQGKYDKAIEMYRKLSLRNPQKNTYFAAKIEKLIQEK
ncbi:MAG TPA: hypothetical protein VL098_00535 [Flavipsychrobacter sp.]|nr:hypothetical protein [Flavipsychrobacter sp.]